MSPNLASLGQPLLTVTEVRAAGLLMAFAAATFGLAIAGVIWKAAPPGALPRPLVGFGAVAAAFCGYFLWTGTRTVRNPQVFFEAFPEGIVPHYGDKGIPRQERGPNGERSGRAVLIPWRDVESIEYRQQFHIFRLPFRTRRRVLSLAVLTLRPGSGPWPVGSVIRLDGDPPNIVYLPAGGDPGGPELVSRLGDLKRQFGR